MKKLIALLLILAMLLPAAALADYSPGLGMSISDFIMKYNSIQAALESPYTALSKPSSWTVWNGYHLAWFSADKSNTVTILLMTKDPKDAQLLTSGLDRIQIFAKSEKDFVALISIAKRITSVFSYELFGVSLADFAISNIIQYYYENNCKEKNMTSYRPINEDETIAVQFFYSNYYYFELFPMEDL